MLEIKTNQLAERLPGNSAPTVSTEGVRLGTSLGAGAITDRADTSGMGCETCSAAVKAECKGDGETLTGSEVEMIVGNMSGVTPATETTAGAPDETALPQERQNFVSVLFSVPQLTQISCGAAS